MRRIVPLAFVACLLSGIAVAAVPEAGQDMTAEQIVARSIDARGGSDAWHKIQSMVWVGHIETGQNPGMPIRYILEMKRPGKTRFEVKAPGRMGARIFDGKEGWKLRPGTDGYPDVQPYSDEEVKFAREDPGIGGPLLDYRDKGVKVILEGQEEVEDHPAYRLLLTLPSGASQRVWIDARSFLELKEEREARNALGMTGNVTVSYRDYHAVQGVQIPYLIETGVGSGKATDKMIIDKVALNAPLDDTQFAKPLVPHRHLIAIGGVNPPSPDAPTWRGAVLRGRGDAAP